MSQKRNRAWCFTSFDMNREPCYISELKGLRYLVYGLEICPKTEKEHWQGYLVLGDNAKTLSAMKKWLQDPAIHLEAAMGTAEQNRTYCTKDKKYKEFGAIPKQGARNDIKEVVDDVEEGMRYDEIAIAHPCQFVKYFKGFKELINAKDRLSAQQRDVEVIVMIGPTGCGKTSHVYNTEEDLFDLVCTKQDMQWFDGYDGQSTLLLDEFGENSIQWEILLRLLDRYPMRLAVKGTFTYARWNKVFITSNLKINAWYPNKDLSPLMRRITSIHDFYKKKSHIVDETGFKTTDLCVTQRLPGNTIPATIFEETDENNLERKTAFRFPHKPI